MTRSPIHKVLSTLRNCNVQFLLTGGQACILYGAAEFSRDADINVLASPENLSALAAALQQLDAEPVFVPPLTVENLERGHACHFRCHEADGARLDVMSVMRGCDPFPGLWQRRVTVDLPDLGDIPVLSLRDLVRSKKTQRDKDWPMVRRLVEVDFLSRRSTAISEDLTWWLSELRTPQYLIEIAHEHPATLRQTASRPWLPDAAAAGPEAVEAGLREEEAAIRAEDRAYWQPLREELERMRRRR